MRMAVLGKITSWVLLLVPVYLKVSLVSAICELSVLHRNNLYNFSLASPTNNYPHGILSEDGFYKVAINDTFLWFQLCDRMIFNHDPPRCFKCEDCGGPLHCGIKCSALVAVRTAGYQVCTTIGKSSGSDVSLIDKKNPQKGVVVKMSSSTSKINCSLSVSVFCDLHGPQGPDSVDKLGACDYTTVLRHPAGCAKICQPSRRIYAGWYGLSVFFPWSPRCRSCPELGILAQFATPISEFIRSFSKKSKRTSSSKPELLYSSTGFFSLRFQ